MHLISSEPSSILILLFLSAASTNEVYFLFLKFLPLASTRLSILVLSNYVTVPLPPSFRKTMCSGYPSLHNTPPLNFLV